MTPLAGFAPQRPMIGLQHNPYQPNSNQANRSAIAGMMGNPGGFGFARQSNPSAHDGFGFAGGASPFGSQQPMPSQMPMGPPSGGQMPVPPSLNFTPGVGTSSPAMTNWRPPQYPPQGAPMPSNPALQPQNMQPMPVSAGSQPFLRPVTR